MIVGQQRYRRAKNGKTDGTNKTFTPVSGDRFMIVGQKRRYLPLMTHDN